MARRSSRSSRSPSACTSSTANDPLASLLGGSNSGVHRHLYNWQMPRADWIGSDPHFNWYDLPEVRDNRQFHPDPEPSPVTVQGTPTWSVVRAPTPTLAYRGFPLVRFPGLQVHRRSMIAREYYTNLPVGLQVPVGIRRVGMFPVLTCVRRKIRKAVMFATGQRHKGSGARRRVRGQNSKVGC